jgi:hypothetical protein
MADLVVELYGTRAGVLSGTWRSPGGLEWVGVAKAEQAPMGSSPEVESVVSGIGDAGKRLSRP